MRRYFYCIVAVLALMSCSKEEARLDFSKHTIRINPMLVYGKYLAGNETSNPYLENTWTSEAGTKFDLTVYLEQDGLISPLGRYKSNPSPEPLDKYSQITVDVPIPFTIDASRDYRVILTTKSSESFKQGNDIVCKYGLARGIRTVLPWYCAHVSPGAVSAAEGAYLNCGEVLYVQNSTEKAISVRHMGFEAATKWYCAQADVKIAPGPPGRVVTTPGAVGEAVSSAIDIPAGENGFIISSFVPNGNKMKDASLVLEIDGKEVKTPPASSDIVIENGIPYFFQVSWDGTTLSWGKSDK